MWEGLREMPSANKEARIWSAPPPIQLNREGNPDLKRGLNQAARAAVNKL
jgi:hypothetical protein